MRPYIPNVGDERQQVVLEATLCQRRYFQSYQFNSSQFVKGEVMVVHQRAQVVATSDVQVSITQGVAGLPKRNPRNSERISRVRSLLRIGRKTVRCMTSA